MIFLEYLYDLPNATSGLDAIVVQTITASPSFTPLLLLFVFLTIFLGGSARQKARTGNADFPMWSVVGSMTTLIIALLMTTISGIIKLEWLIITLVITLFSGAWFFMNYRQSEV